MYCAIIKRKSTVPCFTIRPKSFGFREQCIKTRIARRNLAAVEVIKFHEYNKTNPSSLAPSSAINNPYSSRQNFSQSDGTRSSGSDLNSKTNV